MRFEIDLVLKEQGNKIAQLERDLNKLSSSANNTQRNINGMSGAIKNLSATVVSYIAVSKGLEAVAGLGSVIISNTAAFERYNAQLKVLTGSQANATKSFEEVKKFAKETPFELDKVVEAFIKMRSFGLTGDTEALRVYGDTAAAMGKDVIDVVEAMADAITGENERLKEFGIKASKQGDKIAYSWADASGKAKNIVINNNKETIESTLQAIFNSKYKGQMIEMSNTYEGMMSNLKDSWTQFTVKVGEESGLFNNFKSAVKLLNDEFTNFSSGSQEDIQALGNTVRGFIVGTLESFQGLLFVMNRFSIGIGAIKFVFNTLWEAIKVGYTQVKVFIYGGLKGVADLIASSFSFLPDKQNKFLQASINIQKELNKVKADSIAQFKESKKAVLDEKNAYINGTLDKLRVEEDFNRVINKVKDIFKRVDAKPTKKTNNAVIVPRPDVPGAKDGDISSAFKKTGKAGKEATKEIIDANLAGYLDLIGEKAEAARQRLSETIQGFASSGKYTNEQLVKAWEVGNDEINKVEEDAKNESIKTAEEKSNELLKIYGDYYKAVGDKENEYAIKSVEIIDEINKSDLLPAEKASLTEARLKELKDSIFEIKEIDFSDAGFITYLRAVGKEAEATNIEISNQVAELKRLGQITDAQGVELFNALKKKSADDADKLAKEELANKIKLANDELKKDEELKNKKLQNEFEYYSTVKNYEISFQKELEIYRNSMIEKGYSKQQLIDLEKVKVDELKEKYKGLAIQELESQTTILAGFQLYMNSIEERITNYNALSQELFSGLENTLNSSFTSFFDYSSKGFMDLGQLAGNVFKGMLQEIQQLIIKMLVMKTMQMAFGGGFGGAFANGGAFSGGQVQAFATGTVVNSPTYFPMAGNKTGLMGEAGPEAIMPLTRTSNGKLGVQAMGGGSSAPVVNVNNYSSAQVSTRVNDKGEVDIELIDKIDKQLASRINAGRSQTDKIMNKKYNINKR